MSTSSYSTDTQFTFGTVHLESLANPRKRKSQVGEIAQILAPCDNAMFMGDFNFDSEKGYFGDDGENHILGELVPEFTDCWAAKHYVDGKVDKKNQGKTFDTKTNPNLKDHKEEVMRYDRVMLKSAKWTLESCEVVGYPKKGEICISDHYGLYTELSYNK